ncbi:uncharacterized protein LOC112082983 [Eutrema salsugineum]|uniref:uncharacterized protein LOC112082983 n=1 Tax=Eutrema salsugineum TaxID=72664 RepID=UPI000CED6BAB|nr:uncharacterized protein LOC112082983 [Eutrema salsugineum]
MYKKFLIMKDNGRKRKSLSSFAVIRSFFPCRAKDRDKWNEEKVINVRPRIMSTDEDGCSCIAEPCIDRRATAFIAKFHETRIQDPEYKIITP